LLLWIFGLSPLARGTPPRANSKADPLRFIPAGAGNTSVQVRHGALLTVYPRWRGEHKTCAYSCAARCGLSPLARGTHLKIAACMRCYRFIPAGAGNTEYWRAGYRSPAVYPRWRGEHLLG